MVVLDAMVMTLSPDDRLVGRMPLLPLRCKERRLFSPFEAVDEVSSALRKSGAS